jgi:hypothetical protein
MTMKFNKMLRQLESRIHIENNYTILLVHRVAQKDTGLSITRLIEMVCMLHWPRVKVEITTSICKNLEVALTNIVAQELPLKDLHLKKSKIKPQRMRRAIRLCSGRATMSSTLSSLQLQVQGEGLTNLIPKV